MSRIQQYLVLFVLLVVTSSCLEIGSELIEWNNLTDKDEPVGKYHFLEDSGVKVFIPVEFQRTSLFEYQKILKQLENKELASFEINRLNYLKESKGELYLFRDSITNAMITVNTIPFMPMNKEEAKFFNGMMRQQIEQNIGSAPIAIEKIASQYKGSTNDFVLKAAYKFTNTENKITHFSTSYIITHNLQTVFINLNCGFNAYYDPFALKTIM